MTHNAGAMDVVCPHCAARYFRREVMSCCTHGAVVLPIWRVPPEPLLTIIRDDDFRHRIRGYNCALSLGSSVFDDLTSKNGPATFKISGRSWHLLPCAVQPGGNCHKTAQIYSLPVQDAANQRIELTSSHSRSQLRSDYLQTLHNMLMTHNSLVRSFKQSSASGLDWKIDIGTLEPHATAVNDTMIGLLINGGEDRSSVVIPQRGNGSLVIVPDLDPYYQPLHFVLLFPYGDPQWGMHLSRAINNARKRARATAPVTIHDYLRFHLQRRDALSVCSIHSFGRLFEEWFVDCYLQCENHKLKWVKFNQSKFRREQLSRLHQQLFQGAPPHLIGSPATHLPSSFVRGARHFRELYADAMTLPAKYGGIDYFLTFTTNPSWPEITGNSAIANGMNSPDLYCRVFHIKMKALLADILQNNVLGVVVAFSWAVEFQQRGLPHLHAMFIVRPEDKPHSAAVVDSVLSAQIPDAADHEYFLAVTKHMLHGPCGVHKPSHYCMRNSSCRFDYPKRLCNATTIPADGYTNLARPFGRTYITDAFSFDNSWVVPHNKFLLLKYDAHINVECSASIEVVKYMFSYIYKGTKASSAAVSNANDEIQQFSDGRITSAAEAIWHVLRFEMHSQLPSVIRLGCQLKNDPNVEFDPQQLPDDILAAAEMESEQTNHISAWFDLNTVDEFARTLTYVEIPTFYVWDLAHHKWVRRKTKTLVLGRIYPVDPASREKSALRVLLLHVRGCTSEETIRTVYGEVRPTFVEAAIAAGLLDDDREYHQCLSSPLIRAPALRSLLIIILIHCFPRDPMQLLDTFFDRLTEDFVGTFAEKQIRLFQLIADQVDAPLETLCLEPPPEMELNRGGHLTYWESFVSSPLAEHVGELNFEQQLAHDAILSSTSAMTHGVQGAMFSLLAPAGTGKTFLINSILATARSRGLRVVPCATSGLAAALLGHARTGIAAVCQR